MDDKETKYSKTDEIICDGKDKTYKGIGIIHSISSPYAVLHAPVYYPGYIAGIREGDLVLNPDVQTVNGYVDIEVLRSHNGPLKFHIKAETICFLEE